jgi:hypothetical protein
MISAVDTAKVIYSSIIEWDAGIYGGTVKNMSIHEELA